MKLQEEELVEEVVDSVVQAAQKCAVFLLKLEAAVYEGDFVGEVAIQRRIVCELGSNIVRPSCF